MLRLAVILIWLGSAATAQFSCICLKCLAFQHEMLRAASESMAPALDTGDCALFRKVNTAEPMPERGDILAFEHPVQTDQIYVFRLIGLPGETIQMADGLPVLNGTPVKQTPLGNVERPFPTKPPFPACLSPDRPCMVNAAHEELPNGVVYTVFDVALRPTDNTPTFTVPEGHVFVMGDHRDNALDSRVPQAAGGPGFVPLALVYGILETE